MRYLFTHNDSTRFFVVANSEQKAYGVAQKVCPYSQRGEWEVREEVEKDAKQGGTDFIEVNDSNYPTYEETPRSREKTRSGMSRIYRPVSY